MPRTLRWYILVGQWKLVLLSTAVLVAVIAFAATVKPLADGKLTPAEALQFMFFAVPPMLAFALPFAAGFGTTLAYHRLAQDNEVLAAKAGGVSQRSLLFPALLTGLVLAVGLAGLNEQVIPRFLRSMESMITRNLMQMMVRTIERGDAAEFADLEIYARRIGRVDPEPGSGVTDLYVMRDVTAVALDDNDRIETDVSARRAQLWLVPAAAAGIEDTDDPVAIIRFEDLVYSDGGSFQRWDESTTPPVRVPSAFEDDPKYLTYGELRALRRHPERMNWIEAQRMEVARRIAARATVASLVATLKAQGRVRFTDPQGQEVEVRAGGFEPGTWALEPLPGSGRIEFDIYLGDGGGGGMDRFAAASAVLRVETPQKDPTRPIDDSSLSFALTLEGVVLLGAANIDLAADTGQTERAGRELHGLRPERDALAPLRKLSPAQMIAEARATTDRFETGTEPIVRAADRLAEQLADLRLEIISKEHERMAMAASCLVMVLTGAVTALRLRDRLPLVVYLWSFFPALITVITINTGQQVTHGTGLVGLALLWSGVLGLTVYTLVAFRQVARH
jgi:lipopolysaccharide export LptBFGC system permease protein LptF